MEKKVVIELQNVKRYFQVGSETVKALRGVSFKIYEGEFVTIQGTSGSGKSTLLNQLGCLDTPTSGEYFLDGISVRTMSKTQRAHLRNQKIGFVFQNYNLLAKTTAVENVELPLMYNSKYDASQRREAAIKALEAAVETDKYDQMPDEKGKVKVKYQKANQDRMKMLSVPLVQGGQYYYNSNGHKTYVPKRSLW
jgi:putative ABC transport system ATP-binding protein